MPKSVMLERAEDFAVKSVNLCNSIKNDRKECVLTQQLMKSATSIGANIYESKYAQSNADFVSKMKIALKECYETEYWLRIMFKTEYITENEYKTFTQDCGAIRRMLISSINTSENK